MTTTLPLPVTTAREAAPLCPFHDGAATLDALLAELDPRDTALFDAVLDLRSLASAAADPAACIAQLFRVRAFLDDRHYLAFYRVRCWAHRTFRIEVRASRAAPWLTRALPRDGARLDEIVNSALAILATDNGEIPVAAHVRFAFAAA